MTYLHVDVIVTQQSKRTGQPCGDVVEWMRTVEGTTLAIADGIGSGIKARLAAQFALSRLMEKIRGGSSPRQAFFDIVQTMEANRGKDTPWAAFTLVRVLPEGNAAILSYEMPPPALLARRNASVLDQQSLSSGTALISQATCDLGPGDGLLLVSDGITQAGIGNGLPLGWGMEGVCREAGTRLVFGTPQPELAAAIERRANELAGPIHRDDTTVVLANCRTGVTLNLLTGPPLDSAHDAEVVERFMAYDGFKVICGGTTTDIVGRETGHVPHVDTKNLHPFTPPRYELEGVDLATEGAVCLTQLYHLLDDPDVCFEKRSAVSELYELLQGVDRVRIMAGSAPNPAADSVDFRQQGILSRRQLVPLLAGKLRDAGKLVEVYWH